MTTLRQRLATVLARLVEFVAKVQQRVHELRSVLGRQAAKPAEHVGATVQFGRELRPLRELEVSPELVSDIETELRWGLIWHEFERGMQSEIDRVFSQYLPEPECRDFDELRERMGLQELAAA